MKGQSFVMRIDNQPRTAFKGVLDTPLTKGLNLLNTNPMLNASVIDVFAMGTPRTIVEYKERNKYAGAEMAFREFTGTFIACFSAGLFGQIINKFASKRVNPEIKVNQNSWASNNTIDTLNSIWQNSDKNSKSYTKELFNSMSGLRDDKALSWKDIDWHNIEWYDKDEWNKIHWDNKKFTGVHNRIKSESEILNVFETLISDKTLSKNDTKHLQSILTDRVINAAGAESNVTLKNGISVTSSVQNIIRDSVDLGKNVFNGQNIDASINKLKKLNKIKTFGALALSVTIALTNQALNRYITQKRTGSRDFVGNMNYGEKVAGYENNKHLIFNKFLASAGFAAMLAKVMNVKNLKDFAKRLEFTGPTTSGNAIKTVYGALILGRFIASKDNTELRETVVRDYLGFLNWLVLGGFVAKGVGQLLGKNELINTSKEGKGVKHWLQDLSLKTHSEVAAKGGKNLKSNIRKLNIAHAAGLLYSGIMLGVFLPMLNILMTKHKQNKQ